MCTWVNYGPCSSGNASKSHTRNLSCLDMHCCKFKHDKTVKTYSSILKLQSHLKRITVKFGTPLVSQKINCQTVK